eukprot:m.271249 g.271249  ORF g.271249 m.271249 type:complete len:53 (-) comp16089_c0_seq11:17-175(-)
MSGIPLSTGGAGIDRFSTLSAIRIGDPCTALTQSVAKIALLIVKRVQAPSIN